MNPTCTLQLHAYGAWHDVASVSLHEPAARGWQARSYSGYAFDWAAAHFGARDAHAACANWPVGLDPLQAPHWPAVLIDQLPQGYGRQELLRRLNLPAQAGAAADWPLLLAGAGNPIGHLRVKEAAQWLQQHPSPLQGFSDAQVAQRGDEFAEHLASHGLFVAGSSGVQGEWPKLLLTRADDGLLYLDHTLPDERALEHYIVKFSRGPDPQLASILRHEAPYMDIAARLGLRVHAPLLLLDRALFIRRFDRVVHRPDRQTAATVTRLAQESIATLTGLSGFDKVPSHNQVCAALLQVCTEPHDDILEYIKRDLANLAMGNKDNHARNTAIQRDFNGKIALTPLFDFAPMYLHPDGIARRIRWDDNDGGRPDWGRVLDAVCALAPATLDRGALAAGLKAMQPVLEQLADDGLTLGLEPDVLNHLRPGLLAQAQALRALH